MPRSFTRFLSQLASQCPVCRSWPAGPVCDACVARFSPLQRRCKTCATALPITLAVEERTNPDLCAACIRQPPPVDATFVAVSYAWPWSELLAKFKFSNCPGWAPFFAAQLIRQAQVAQALASMKVGDLILPVPLSAQRLELRGFNQAWELARALSACTPRGVTAAPGLLLRIRDTRAQTELKREARISNVKGAFAVDPLRAARVAGRRIVLIDDVMTSGASLFAAAEALRASGAAHITAMAFARTAAA